MAYIHVQWLMRVLGMTLNCIHISLSLVVFVLMCHEAGQVAFLHIQLSLTTNLDHILFSNVSGTNSLSLLMCRKAGNQSINQWLMPCIFDLGDVYYFIIIALAIERTLF